MADLDEVGKPIGLAIHDDDLATTSGFVISQLGRIPEENELPAVTYENLVIKVLAMEEKRVSKVEILVQPDPSEDTEEA